ncbi:hypothetical protein BaRGS_00012498 [Batillaria attramentaria]|uniref:Uncharacterized protein n=1 Tax=Batillaria attramentaria TaxID=370345 RepID=A0ABD0LAR4_9CAEN
MERTHPATAGNNFNHCQLSEYEISRTCGSPAALTANCLARKPFFSFHVVTDMTVAGHTRTHLCCSRDKSPISLAH